MQHFSSFIRWRFLLWLMLAGLPLRLLAQGVGIGTTAPDASAALEIVSTNRGALLPRLSETARSTMGNPAPGLIVYQTNGSQPGFWYNSGTAAVPNWVRLTDSDGVKYDPVSGLQVGPGPVTTSSGPFTVLGASFSLTLPFSGNATLKQEAIYTAAELLASGVHAGQLLSITYIVAYKTSTTPFNNFSVSLGHTTAATTSTSFTTGLTPVYSGNLTTTLGDNKLVFNQNPFSWDGTSNIVVQTCYSNAGSGGSDAANNLSDASNQLLYSTVSCAAATGTQYASRPQVRFTQPGSNGYTLPPVAGATNQILVMQANGTAIWDDPAWLRNGVHAYRPFGPGTVGIGTSSSRTRLSLTPSTVEPKITLWDGGSTANHYGFGVSASQLNYHIDQPASSHVFYAGGKNGPDTPGSTELMRLKGNGFLTVGGAGAGDARLEIVNDGGGSGGADDMVLRSYGATAGPGFSLQRYAGTQAAPAAVQPGDFIGDIGFVANTSNGLGYFNTSGMFSHYRGNGSTFLSDLYFKTSAAARMRIDENGLVGIGTMTPAHPLHVQGAIAANTDKGIILDAQDRPIITRSWDVFTSGNYNGLGRWGLFMEPYTLTMGVPVMGGRNMQWATYNLDSSIGSVLMHLSQNGFLGLGTTGAAGTRLDIVSDNQGGGGADDVMLRSYDPGGSPGIGMRRYRGTQAAPANVQNGDFMGEFGISAYFNNSQNAFNLSGMQAFYQGNGTTTATDLRLLTSGSVRALIDATGRVGIGTTTPAYLLDVNGVLNGVRLYAGASPALYFGSVNSTNLWVGTRTENSMGATGGNNVSLGPSAGRALTSGVNNSLLGQGAGFALADGGYNTIIGTSAGYQTVSDNFNTLVGYAAGGGLNGGGSNTMLGYLAGNNLTTGSSNVALGYRAGNSLGAGMRNTLVGNAAGDDASNFDNTAVGSSAGASLSTGGRNTFLGAGADLASTTQRTNAAAIGYQAKVDQSNSLVLGGTGANAVKVGIGITAPTQRLEVVEPNAGGYAIYGRTTAFSGADGRGVYGQSDAGEGIGYGGYFDGGYMGLRANGNSGNSSFGYGVYANVEGNAGTRYAVRALASVSSGTAAYGIYASASGATTNYAGYFAGNVHVTGTLSKAAGSFRIDHPQDPANKYLVHSFVESPDMLNVYNGNVTTDAQGRATVSLPAYFEAENMDFKYQLTVIGADFAQTRVAQEVQGNQFVIATDKPNVKISWQVTGVRNDKYAQQHRLVPEEPKKAAERGKYLNPELYGRPASEGIAAPEEARDVKTAQR